MLKAQYRLRKTKDIEAVMRRGQSAFGGKISIKALKNGLDYSRFAFVVGVKVAKSAVKRNAIKRRMREVVRLRFDDIKPGFDVMVMARPGAQDLEFADIRDLILKNLKKLRLL